ncbi:MAG: hypothetical protein HeimC2_30240 [Candidatus Heimdallarchaeota archaeon LC_2]|nr:MAG: hypothetical protein HeimC2_30240 [Candidatus Heimdallarchaeota archaeon LC_2]
MYEHETLTSWIKRIAQNHLNSIPVIINEPNLRLVNVDVIDNNPTNKLLNFLVSKTGIEKKEMIDHTLISFDDNFPTTKGVRKNLRKGLSDANYYSERFLLSSRRSKKNGNRYCPLCLEEKMYFRIYWKLGYYTACHKHNIFLHNKCRNCNKPVYYFNNTTEIDKCRVCKSEWKNAKIIEADTSVTKMLHEVFMNKISPIEYYTAPQFLGYFWNAFSNMKNADIGYRESLLELYGFNSKFYTEIEENHILLKLVWDLWKNKTITWEKPIRCLKCDEKSSSYSKLTRHMIFHDLPTIICKTCGETMHRKDQLKRHKKVHRISNSLCMFCESPFTTKKRMTDHIIKTHRVSLIAMLESEVRRLREYQSIVTIQLVCNNLGISRSIINNYEEFRIIITNANTLRYRYFKNSKNDKRISHQINLISEVMIKLEESGVEINQKSISNELGVNRIIFFNNPTYRKIVNDYLRK